MQVQRLIDGGMKVLLAIASSGVVHFLPLPSLSMLGHPAIASSQSIVAFERMGLPHAAANTVQRTFQRDYQNRIDRLRIVHVKPATWLIQDVSEELRSHIATTLQSSPGNLKILAASEETFLPATACPTEGFCPIPPIYLGWRVLAVTNGRDRVVRLRGFGSPIHPDTKFERNDAATLGTLPVALANAVMQDAQERLNTPELILATSPDAPATIGVQVESIQPVAWNECGGGTGPSLPLRGTCPNGSVSGWRVVVAGGGSSELFRLVYYIPQGATVGSWTPQPDGLQSLSEAVQRRILAQAAADAGIPTSSLRLFWADARFFDQCLNTRDGVPSYGTAIRPGWAVQILVNQTTPGTPVQQPLRIYHTNITGTDVRLVGQGQWMPPP